MKSLRIAEIGRERGFVVPTVRAKQLSLLAIAAGGAAISVLMIIDGAVLAGAFCATFCGAMMLLGLRGLVGQRGLALTPTLLVFLGPGRIEIPWDIVESVGLVRQGPSTLMGVDVTNPSLLERRRTRWLGAVNRSLAGTDITFPVNLLAGGPEAALDFVAGYLEHPERRSAIGTEPELARVI